MGRKKKNPRFAVDRLQYFLKVQRDEIAKKSKIYRKKQEKVRRLQQKVELPIYPTRSYILTDFGKCKKCLLIIYLCFVFSFCLMLFYW